MPRALRFTLKTGTSETQFGLTPFHDESEVLLREALKLPVIQALYSLSRDLYGDHDYSAIIPPDDLTHVVEAIDPDRAFGSDRVLAEQLTTFRDALLQHARNRDLSVTAWLSRDRTDAPAFSHDVTRTPSIDINAFIAEARQQELIALADAGQGASAVRLAIRETAAAYRNMLQLH